MIMMIMSKLYNNQIKPEPSTRNQVQEALPQFSRTTFVHCNICLHCDNTISLESNHWKPAKVGRPFSRTYYFDQKKKQINKIKYERVNK